MKQTYDKHMREDLDPMVIFYQTSIIGIRQTLRRGKSFELIAFNDIQLEELLTIMDRRLNGIEYIAEVTDCEDGTTYQIKAIPIRQSRIASRKAYLVKHDDIIKYCQKRGLTFKQMSELMGCSDQYITSVLRNHTYNDKSCVTADNAIEFELLGIDVEVTTFEAIGSKKNSFGASQYVVCCSDIEQYLKNNNMTRAQLSIDLDRNEGFISGLMRRINPNGWAPIRYDIVAKFEELGIRVRSVNDIE